MGNAGVGAISGSGFAFKLEGDGDAKIGNTSNDLIQITGSVDVDGTTQSTQYVTSVGTQDLGNGQSSNLSISAGVMMLDADSITGADAGGGMLVHTLTLPNGTTNGQRLTIIVNTTFGSSDNIMIMPNPSNIGGAFGALVANSKTSIEFIWYGSHWFPVQ